MNNRALEKMLNQLLEIEQYNDYAPNGLQVQGRSEVNKIITGVTASMALIDKAIAENADAIIVHHGYFWKGETLVITDMKQRRIKALLENGINLYAYHLPLDGHTELGNNAALGQLWSVTNAAPVAPYDLVWQGELPELSVAEFGHILSSTLSREPLVISGGDHKIRRIAWCSGGAQGFLERAVDLNVDAYISGEVSEKTYHEAKEYGIHYFSAGHHATERGGVLALSKFLNKTTQLASQFIDINNPV